ncbi:MAG: BNR repeat-containing protein [Clostridia bacterium]|nr:BNR repeat-containing protein [Clostridia bacterium]
MKKVLAMVLALCMVMAFVPAVSFAADTTINAVRTAYFNSNGNEWKATDGDNVLVSAGATGWTGATSFTDTDGTVTTQGSLSGTGFGSARNAVIAFQIPADFDPDNTAKVTLSVKVKNVKQTTAGVRLSVYGNSVDGSWSTSSSTSIFGVSGSNSGLTSLELLGLMDALKTGNQTGESASDETVTLSSQKLTEYVCRMAEEGKSEVTFRLACTLGGIRIYDTNTSTPPTLSIEEGKVTDVTVKTVYMNGEEEVSSTTTTVSNIIAGSTYEYTGTPAFSAVIDDVIYTYSKDDSTLSVVAKEDGSSEIVLVYNKYDETQTFSGYEVDDEGAWCWFADPRAISYANEEGTLDFTIMGYIDIHGNIKATQVNNLTDEVNEVLIRTNIQPDDHNNPTFLVLPDERIIVFYSRHTDEACFWYRVTKEPGDLTTLGEEKRLDTEAATTYPSPFILSDDPDHIYLCWRGIEWHPTIAKLSMPDENGDTEFVYGPYQLVRSTNAGSNVRPYAKYASNGKDKILISYTGTHPDNTNPNWLYFNYINIDTMTMHDVNGNQMSTIANGPLAVDHSNQSHIVDQTDGVRNWLWQVAVDENGYPVIANVRINGGKTSHDYYYVKWNGTAWVKTFLSNAGGHFHQTPGFEMCYSGGMAIDPADTNVMYGSVPVEGAFGKIYEIVKFTVSNDGTEVIATEQITKNSMKNNVRPYIIGNDPDDEIRLAWLYGDYYDWIVRKNHNPLGYCTSVMAEKPLPTKDVDLDDAVASEDYASIDGSFRATKETANIVEAAENGNFTVSADIYLEGDYEGKLLDLGGVELSVESLNTVYGDNNETEKERARVVLTVDGEDYVTSNVYGSSDCWRELQGQTGGEYMVEDYHGYITHTITYDGTYLTLYRDGLVDYKLEAEGLKLENVEVGGFDGLADNVYVFDRVLNHDEIKAVAEAKGEVEEPDSEGTATVTKTYVDVVDGTVLDSATLTLPAGTDKFNFVPEETIETENAVYAYDSYEGEGNNYTVYYYATTMYGENLVSMSDLTRASDGGALGWIEVNKSTLDSSLTGTYIHTTTIGGGTAASTMRTFVPVEGGKSYLVSNTIYNNTGATTTNQGSAGMSAIIATGDAVYGTFAGLTLYSDVDNGGVTSWTNTNSDVTWVGTASGRNDIVTVPGENKVEYIVNTPAEAKNIMLSYGGWGNAELYYGDFSVREIIDVETVDVTVDGDIVKTYGTYNLGNADGTLGENVIGYYVASDNDTIFVGAGEIAVSDGDAITTAYINAKMVTGAQVRYGGGLDENGKVNAGNGLRFIAEVDRSQVGEEVTGYGMKITAEGSDKSLDIPAEKWQDGDSQTIFTAAVTDLATSNYNRKYTAAPYVKVKYTDGKEATIYGTETITRSIYAVAAGLLKNADSDTVDGNDTDYSTDSYGLYDVLNAYVNMVGIRLEMEGDSFGVYTEGKGAYSGDIFFDVTSEKVSEGVYNVTITPLADFNSKVTILSYWDEFVRINNNHSLVVNGISNSSVSEDGTLTFTFTVSDAK